MSALHFPCHASQDDILVQRRSFAWLASNRINPPVVRFDNSLQNSAFISSDNSKIMTSPHVSEGISVFGYDDMPLYNGLV